jgi:hypothetical protein
MPYVIRYIEGDERPYKIVNKDRNEVVGSSTTRAKAEASIRHREKAKDNPDQTKAKQYAKARKKARPR